MIKLAPSVLAANFARLGEEIALVEQAGAQYLHIDVMDGVFVPNISLGIPVIESIRRVTSMTFDVHLMLHVPEKYIEDIAAAGADIISVHVESVRSIRKVLTQIKALGKKASISIKPHTPIEFVLDDLDLADMVLVMSVEPGFGGQTLMPRTLEKAAQLREFIDKNKLQTDIELDGGITLQNVGRVLQSGVNVVVAGSSIFDQPDPSAAVKDFFDAFENVKKGSS